MPPALMSHIEDPANEIRKRIGDISQIEVLHNQILVGVYIRPEKTKGGILLTSQTRDEDRYQGKAGLVLKKGPLAFVDDHLGVADHRGAVIERHREVDQLHRRVVGFAARDTVEAVAAFRLFQRVERDHQRGDTPRRRIPVGQPRIIVDQPRERRLHDGEGRGRLHHHAQRH